MPRVKKREKVEVTLILSQEEAEWLKGVMQNPFTHNVDEDFPGESSSNKGLRWSFFTVLKEELDNV